jgi:serine phosphatase RsbU (regulator of sigma subunit)
MFEDWKGSSRDVALDEGDVVALYSDGVIEARNAQDDEFGVERLTDVLKTCVRDVSTASDVLSRAMTAVQAFAAGPSFDDMTMVIARCRR